MQEFDPHIGLVDHRAIETLSKTEKERMKRDPVAMYLHSLRTQSRLPDELHESMLLHSFDPVMSHNVRAYLDWVQSCEERDARLVADRRRERMLERMMTCSMVVAMICYVAVVIWGLTR